MVTTQIRCLAHAARRRSKEGGTLATALLCMTVAHAGTPDLGAPDNLVRNGGFEQADAEYPARPAHWDVPDGLGVIWAQAEGDHGKAIRMDTAISETRMVRQWRTTGIDKWDIPDAEDNPIAATYGLSFYSATIPVTSGQCYRVSFDFKGRNNGAKVWVRAYGMFRGEKRRRYEVLVNCRVPDQRWHRFSQDFHPTRRTPAVSEMKVMLYAYWPPGVYWFDNVRIEPVRETP